MADNKPIFWMMDLDDTLTDIAGGVDIKPMHDYSSAWLSCVEVACSLPLYTAPPAANQATELLREIRTMFSNGEAEITKDMQGGIFTWFDRVDSVLQGQAQTDPVKQWRADFPAY